MGATACSRAYSACKIYFSEGRDRLLLQKIQEVASSQEGVALLDSHIDQPYNRTGILLASREPSLLLQGAARVAKEVFGKLDLREHQASHPRTGVIDHISCSPLSPSAGLSKVAELARSLGKILGEGEQGVPVFFYGHASPKRASLADIRRALGYFKGSQEGVWNQAVQLESADLQPEYGPRAIPEQAGVVVIGASEWITNYNLLLDSQDFVTVRKIARAVSERGGGIRGIEAMALRHQEGIEVACNMHGASEDLKQQVLSRVTRSCQEHNIRLLDEYIIGKTPSEYITQLEGTNLS